MTMLTDLHDLPEAERHAVCAELARMLRVVPINLLPAASDDASLPVLGSGAVGGSHLEPSP